MFSKSFRPILITICFGLSVAFTLQNAYYEAVLFSIAGALLIIGHFRHSSVWLAMYYFKKRQFEKGRKHLISIKNPDRLVKSTRGYYYWGMGIINVFDKDFGTAITNFEKALAIGMRTKHDLAIIHLNLAEVHLLQGEADRAKSYLQQAKSTPHKHVLNTLIQSVERKIADAEKE